MVDSSEELRNRMARKLQKIINSRITTRLRNWLDNYCGSINQLHVLRSATGAALHFVVASRWLEGVQMLVEAGADVNLFAPWNLRLADDDLLLKTLKYSMLNCKFTPLMIAAISGDTYDIAEYLVAHGADPHLRCPVTSKSILPLTVSYGNIHLVAFLIDKCRVQCNCSQLLTIALYGSDMNPFSRGRSPQNEMMIASFLVRRGAHSGLHYGRIVQLVLSVPNPCFEILDLFFGEGNNIHSLCVPARSMRIALPNARRHGNFFRWQLRHGLDTYIHFSQHTFSQALNSHNFDFAIVLFHAGICYQSRDMDLYHLTMMMQRDKLLPPSDYDIGNFYRDLKQINDPTGQRWNQQADLLEFSDESLNIYPKEDELTENDTDEQVQRLYDLLSHPLTLKGLCRQCLRQSLCEPSPTVVRTLPIPRALKRYILCHDL